MSKRQYPRQVWVLQPSFKPVEVTVVKQYGSSFHDYGDLTEKGKLYSVEAMHQSKCDAIVAGRQQVSKLQADIAKRQDTLNKRIAALDKAEKESK